jgi:CSLREA domain-containing protein
VYNAQGTLTLTNCTVSGNAANTSPSFFSSGGSGGGVYNYLGTATLTDCTVSGNSASKGGGLSTSKGTTTLANTIVAANTAASGPDVAGVVVSNGSNLIGATDGSSGWVSADLTGTSAHLLNAELAPLGDYGGPTQTMPELYGSPAIGAGNVGLVPAGVTTDQRGQARFLGGKVDIGAYELQVVLAPSFVVNTTADYSDPIDGKTSLREAIASANALPGHTITFDPAVFARPQVITLTGLPLELSAPTGTETLTAPAAGLTVSGGGLSQVFLVDGGVTASVLGLTITGGNAATVGGGGVRNAGTLTMINSTISGNSASNGGGLFNTGALTLTNSTISGNSASGSASIGAGRGGGVNNAGALTLTNCTVSGNSAQSGGGVISTAGTNTLGNTIVAGNMVQFFGPDVAGVVVSNGSNLIGARDGSSGWVGSDLTGTSANPLNAELAPLGNYGGATQTMPELYGSPAIGAGNTTLVPAGVTTDQRGQPRFFGAKVDLGAYELQVVLVPSFVVDTTADYSDPTDGKTSLREAVASANAIPGQTITFDQSVFKKARTITLTGAPLELSDTSGTETITGPTAGVTVSGGELSRVFQVDGLVTASISGLTITVGSAFIGGGVNNNGSLALTNCTITGNSATSNGILGVGTGGGGLNNTGSLSMTNCTVSGNSAYAGCGVANGGTATLTNCTVSGNSSTGNGPFGGGLASGGGLFNAAALTLTGCTVSGNSAVFGGGLYTISYGTSSLANCTVSGNTAQFGGGGLFDFAPYATAKLTNCTVSGNSTGFGLGGGGVYNGFYSRLTMTNCTVSGNKDNSRGGGGVINSGSTATLINCTISGNSTTASGGGVLNYGFYSTLTMTNCSVSGNSASAGGGIANQQNQSTLTVASCTISKNQATSAGGGITTTGGSATITGSVIQDNKVKSPTTALGGGIYCANSQLSVANCTIKGNEANGTNVESGATGGSGLGGGIYADIGAVVTITGSTITDNRAHGGDAEEGGTAGNGLGAGFYVAGGASVTITASTITYNRAEGGDGDDGGNGGNGLGGGIYVASGATVTVTGCTITDNHAKGGEGDDDGGDGLGIGGGVYDLGTFTFDASTVIAENHASTSGKNIGP